MPTSTITVKVNDVLCINPMGSSQVNNVLISNGFINLNGFRSLGGGQPGYGKFLLLRKDLDNMDKEGLFDVEISETSDSPDGQYTNTVSIQNLLFVDSHAVYPTQGENDLFVVTLADQRVLGLRFEQRPDEPIFPPLEKLQVNLSQETKDNFAEDNNDGIQKCWEQTNIQVELDSETHSDFPSVLIRDVRTEHDKTMWYTLNQVLNHMSHRIYFNLTDKFEVHKMSNVIPNQNQDTANAYEPFLISQKQPQEGDVAEKPKNIIVRYRSLESDYFHHNWREPLTFMFSTDTAGSLDTQKQINAFNIYDELSDDPAQTYKFDLETLAMELSDLYQDAFDNDDKLNATYFGVVPFEPCPEADIIEWYHDATDGKYKTFVQSIQMDEYPSTMVTSYQTTVDNYICRPVTVTSEGNTEASFPAADNSDGLLVAGKATCEMYVLEEIGPDVGEFYAKQVMIGEQKYTETVFNISTEELAPGYYTCVRLKSGQFVVLAGSGSDSACFRFILTSFPFVGACGLIEVQGRRQIWDEAQCAFVTDTSSAETIRLPFYGVFPANTIINPDIYGIRPGNIIFAEFSGMFNSYITKKCIYTGTHKLVEALSCDITETILIPDGVGGTENKTIVDPDALEIYDYAFEAGNICKRTPCEEASPTCCWEFDYLSDPFPCSDPDPGGPIGEQILCVNNVYWNEADGILEADVELPADPSIGNMFTGQLCFVAFIDSACSLEEYQDFYVTEQDGVSSGMTSGTNNPTICIDLVDEPLPYNVRVSLDTNFEELLVDPGGAGNLCCTFRAQITAFKDTMIPPNGAGGISVAEVRYKEIPCAPCSYICTGDDSPSFDPSLYEVTVICTGETTVKLEIVAVGGNEVNGDIGFVTVTVDTPDGPEQVYNDYFGPTAGFLYHSVDIMYDNSLPPESITSDLRIHQGGQDGPILPNSDGRYTCLRSDQ